MKTYNADFSTNNGFGLTENPDVALATILCAGTTFATAAVVNVSILNFYKRVIIAIPTPSNVGIVLPQGGDTVMGEMDLIADGGAVTVYAAAGEQFTGGATSISMTDGQYHKLRKRTVPGSFPPVFEWMLLS